VIDQSSKIPQETEIII